jgi:hypothetical protein
VVAKSTEPGIDAGNDLPTGSWQPRLVLRSSSWSEFRADGKRLLKEQGELVGLGGVARWSADYGSLELGLEVLRGHRCYDGQTGSGAPASTVVDVRESAVSLASKLRISPSWRFIGALDHGLLHRRLRSSAGAQGYTERWQWTPLHFGLEWWKREGSAEWEAGAAGGPVLNPRVQVNIADFDLAMVKPSRASSRRLWLGHHSDLSLDHPLQWRLSFTVIAEQTRFDASEPVPLYAHGILRAGISQPHTRWENSQISVALRAKWR